MKGSEEHIDELIERYVLGQMSAEELDAFEKEIQADTGLQEKVIDFQILRGVVQAESEVSHFERTLRSVVREKQERPAAFTWWRLAAILLFGLSVAITLYQLSSSRNTTELALAYFEPFPDLITSRDEADSIVSLAMTAYNNQAFKQAIPYLNQLRNPETPLFEFYLGICFQASGQYEKALDIWSIMETYDDPALIYSLKWYKALSFLGMDKVDDASNLLQELATQPSSVQARAQELLDEL